MGVIDEVRFSGEGCSISQASASMFAEHAKGKSVSELQGLTEVFRTWMRDRTTTEVPEELGDLEALSGVKRYPARVKCALLAWTTAEEALRV